MIDSKLMTRAADNIRILAASMVEQAKSGHPGGAMGGAYFVNVLFSKYLVTDPDNPAWFARDRFFLDPGHMSPMLYSVLHLAGRYTTDDLKAFRSWGSITPGHPELDVEHGVENTSGPLGQGHVMAVGAAIAERYIATHYSEVFAHKTYAFISDGGVQEGISQEAARIAGYLGLTLGDMLSPRKKARKNGDLQIEEEAPSRSGGRRPRITASSKRPKRVAVEKEEDQTFMEQDPLSDISLDTATTDDDIDAILDEIHSRKG